MRIPACRTSCSSSRDNLELDGVWPIAVGSNLIELGRLFVELGWV